MNMMLHAIGFGLLFLLSIQANEVPVQKDFNPQLFTGKWYGIAAASNNPMFLKMKKDLSRPIIVFTLHGNDFKAEIGYMTPKGCQKRVMTYHAIANGHYSSSDQGKMDIRIIGTDYKSFALEYTLAEQENKETSVMLKLYGRKTDMPAEVQKQYEQYCASLGLTKDHMVVFPNADECVPGKF
ncbi:olfactory protein-like [Spea bombifrons]|uniref:olfactory protein-like n=1 Tax=Spea bombifrons TaxID=233779 RepID=UPI00234B4F73|nr:olfactory protein-like [Spea bombifrons]XP_053329520.1 olfactory protein-like [Spea bombifrons]